MSDYAWMPFFVADYLADTGHLTTLQHGAYLLLIMHYWQTGRLPKDDGQLALVARMTARQWQANRDVLAAFFGRGWKHKRIDAERERAQKTRENRQKAAYAKHNKNNEFHAHAPAMHISRATLTPHQKDSSLRSESKIARFRSRSSDAVPEGETGRKKKPNGALAHPKRGSRFDRFWRAYPHKVGKRAAAVAFGQALRRASLDEILAGLERYKATKPPERNWCNPLTFLDEDRWLDEPGPPALNGKPVAGDEFVPSDDPKIQPLLSGYRWTHKHDPPVAEQNGRTGFLLPRDQVQRSRQAR